MKYISVSEFAERSNISIRTVQNLCNQGKIIGAVKTGKIWVIPESARYEKKGTVVIKGSNTIELTKSGYYPFVILSDVFKAKINDVFDFPEEIIGHDDLVEQYRYEAFEAQGKLELFKKYYTSLDKDAPTKLVASTVAMVSSISLGDYNLYATVDRGLKYIMKKAKRLNDDLTIKLVEIVYSLIGAALQVPQMISPWIRNGDFSSLPEHLKVTAVFAHLKTLQTDKEYEKLYYMSKMFIQLNKTDNYISTMDIYSNLLCAIACCNTDRLSEAEIYVRQAIDYVIPSAVWAPIVENMAKLGGLVEKVVGDVCPPFLAVIKMEWEQKWRNWPEFHNKFAHDNITLILTLDEYQIATMVTSGMSYNEVADTAGITYRQLRSMMDKIRKKLMVNSNSQLSSLITWNAEE